MRYRRMAIEVESPEELGYGRIRYNLSESSIADQSLSGLGLEVPDLTLLYNEHRGTSALRALVVAGAAGLTADDVLITSGAAGALFIVATSLLEPGDHLVVVRPNYALTCTPRAPSVVRSVASICGSRTAISLMLTLSRQQLRRVPSS
jgi:hypothetical protein